MTLNKITIGVDGWGRPRRVINEVGNTYGRLKVVKRSRKPNKQFGTKWVCKCSCGRIAVVGGAQLRIGNTTSCGCYWEEIRNTGCHRLPVGEASIRRAIGRAQASATKRLLPWTLTREQTIALMQATCHYCGSAPTNLMRGANGEFKWNGIDQKTAGLGYVTENCVTCCITCNRIKSDTPYTTFIERCLRIAEVRGWKRP